ncbi:MaoC family dehydratase [Sphingomonas prati]|uniref:Acyl dehydratase n=1 Tax=Sphingomonas prati TaxID=1843237 RepID=A0A7W9BQ29_9SPHN|nr:MaoC family dehydratase [Sphingomonas prati]MBB5727553.1 acyl dehydratase [Sphingomonas prati]GGE78840.1 acyl dehydratase [Sphingomonas prati]
MAWFEDFEVGQTAAFGRYVVDRDEVLDFARKYDPQPFHLSDEAAAETHFSRLAASGWHSTAMTMAMIVANMGNDGDVGGSLGAAGIDELRWLRPVHPGDILRCETEIVTVTPSRTRPDRGTVRTRVTVLNQDDVPVLTFIPTALFRRRPTAAEA